MKENQGKKGYVCFAMSLKMRTMQYFDAKHIATYERITRSCWMKIQHWKIYSTQRQRKLRIKLGYSWSRLKQNESCWLKVVACLDVDLEFSELKSSNGKLHNINDISDTIHTLRSLVTRMGLRHTLMVYAPYPNSWLWIDVFIYHSLIFPGSCKCRDIWLILLGSLNALFSDWLKM